MEKIILASASPRRSEILKQLGIPFTAIPSYIKEDLLGLPPIEESIRLASLKTEAVLEFSETMKSEWILGADTFVVLFSEIIGKPRDESEAREYLSRLSGNTHSVITGLSLYSPERGLVTSYSETFVTFATLSDEEISWYLSTKEWDGVAGGYRIQERGGVFITGLKGSSSNVMGLPTHTFYGMLRAAGYPLF